MAAAFDELDLPDLEKCEPEKPQFYIHVLPCRSILMYSNLIYIRILNVLYYIILYPKLTINPIRNNNLFHHVSTCFFCTARLESPWVYHGFRRFLTPGISLQPSTWT